MNCDNFKWRIALTEGGLEFGAFAVNGIPLPSQAPYLDHSSVVPQSEGGQAAHGYINLRILWDEMTQSELFQLRRFIDEARSTTGVIYLTIEPQNGTFPGDTFIDVVGKPGVPTWTGAAPYNRIGQKSSKNIELIVNAITVVNSPSNFS